jgi:hypothetical protein
MIRVRWLSAPSAPVTLERFGQSTTCNWHFLGFAPLIKPIERLLRKKRVQPLSPPSLPVCHLSWSNLKTPSGQWIRELSQCHVFSLSNPYFPQRQGVPSDNGRSIRRHYQGLLRLEVVDTQRLRGDQARALMNQALASKVTMNIAGGNVPRRSRLTELR